MTSSQCRIYLQGLQRFGIKLGLDNIKTVLSSFHDPQETFPSVLVAGTNGKGSVCAMLAEILSVHGFKVGLYTSPHLVNVEERIRIGGAAIRSRDFCRLTSLIKNTIDGLIAGKKLEAHPTFFEVLTALAFLYFREKNIDIAVLEVGMGGRFDATNVVRPQVSVITNVSKDHQEYLGNKLGLIAFEKAGIIKSGVPVVCGVSSGVAARIIRRRAIEEKAPLFDIFGKSGRPVAEKKKDRFVFRFPFGGETFEFSPGLRGEHQGKNAALAIAAASVLSRVWKVLDKRKIIRGVEQAKWEGRLEQISRNPRIILDGAHNEAGAVVLSQYIEDFCARPRVLVFAMMRDKAVKRVAGILFPCVEKVVLTSIPYPRAAAPEEILSLTRPFKRKIIIEPSLRKAVNIARAESGRRGSVLITGSLFLVGEVKKRPCIIRAKNAKFTP